MLLDFTGFTRQNVFAVSCCARQAQQIGFPHKILMSIIPAPCLDAHPKAANWTYIFVK